MCGEIGRESASKIAEHRRMSDPNLRAPLPCHFTPKDGLIIGTLATIAFSARQHRIFDRRRAATA
jgi:hypothetical protein